MIPFLAGLPSSVLFLRSTACRRRERILFARHHDLLHFESDVQRDGLEALFVPVPNVVDARDDGEPLGHEQSIRAVELRDCWRVGFDESIAVGLQEVIDLGFCVRHCSNEGG